MKKGLILLILALISLPIAYAQEISIFGQEFSLLLVAPIAFMGVIALIFLFIVVKDNLAKIHLPSFHFKTHKPKAHKENEVAERKDFTTNFSPLSS